MNRFVLIWIIAISIIAVPIHAEYSLWYSEDFVDNATLYANGWVKTNTSWNDGFNITNGRWHPIGSNPSALYNPSLKNNMSLSGAYYILFDTYTTGYSTLDFLEFGLSAPQNMTLNHMANIRVSEKNDASGNFFLIMDADGTYCTTNDSTRYTFGPVLYNSSILYNLSINNTKWRLTNNYTATSYAWTVTCQNQSNMTLDIMSRYQASRIDYLRIYNYYPIVNRINAVLPEPENGSVMNSPFNIKVEYSGSFNTVNCTAYINNTPSNWKIVENESDNEISSGALSDGIYSVYVNCSNASTWNITSSMNYTVDNTEPSITVSSPFTDNTSVFDVVLNITGYVNDTNLDTVNVTVRDSSNNIVYDFGISGLMTPYYDFTDDAIDISAWMNGFYYLTVRADDGLNYAYTEVTFEKFDCIPDWICDSYEPCHTDDVTVCGSVLDLNSCGDAYPGNLSLDFGNFSCNYCSMNAYNLSFGNVCIQGVLNYSVRDSNFSTCCLVTGLSSDCVWNGYDLRLYDGNYTIYENCSIKQEIDLGFNVMLVLMIIVGLVLMYIGLAFSLNVMNLASGLLFVILGGWAVETAWIKIFLVILGFVILMIFAMIEYDNWR